MANEKLKLVTKGGLGLVSIGELKISKFEKQWDISQHTQNVCPKCNTPTSSKEHPTDLVYEAGYSCKCGYQTKTWFGLKRVWRNTTDKVEKFVLKNKGESATAILYHIPIAEFTKSERADVEIDEYGETSSDSMTRDNISKLLIGSQELSELIVMKWQSEYEDHIALLSIAPSRRIIIREIPPTNLSIAMQTEMAKEKSEFTAEQIEEAKQFVKTLPLATPEVFMAGDWRTKAPEVEASSDSSVVALESVLAKAKVEAPKTEKLVEVQTPPTKKRKSA